MVNNILSIILQNCRKNNTDKVLMEKTPYKSTTYNWHDFGYMKETGSEI